MTKRWTVNGVTIWLEPGAIGDRERRILAAPAVEVTGFRYASGVQAIRVAAGRVEAVILPFRGQQVWRLAVDGEALTMRTTFDEPTASTQFGESYGAFLLHCGLLGMGHPGAGDAHPLHGELPTASYHDAWLRAGTDDGGAWLEVGGTYRHRVSHGCDYAFTPRLRFRPDRPVVEATVTIENRSRSELGYQYMCHVNWPLWDSGRLEQTVSLDDAHVTLAPDDNSDTETLAYLERISRDLASSADVSRGMHLVPEYCAILTPISDASGWAHFAMTRPDGRAAAVSYETAHLPHAIRWLTATPDESAAGFCLPSTGHHFGRARSQADGLVRTLAPRASVVSHLTFGLLDAAEASAFTSHIARTLKEGATA